MITFKAIIVPGNKRSDGVYPVKIRVTFKGVSRRLPTTLVCYPADLTRQNKIKNQTILLHAENLIRKMRDAVADISPFDLEDHDVDWVVAYIRAKMTADTFRLDFFEWSQEYGAKLTVQSRNVITVAVNAFRDFTGGRIDINSITKKLLLDFAEWFDRQPKMSGKRKPTDKPKQANSSAREVAKLARVFNAARKAYNDEDTGRILIPRDPFSSLDLEKPISGGQSNLGIQMIQRLIDTQTDNPRVRLSLDVFLFSFCTMGPNIADLYEIDRLKDGVMVYNRAKTRDRRRDRAEMRVFVPKEAQPYMARLKGRHGQFMGRLREITHSKDGCTDRVNRGLARWCQDNGVERFTFYACRHSWASIARSLGVEKALVDEALAHVGEFRMADIYAERDWKLINEANAKVLAAFKWPEK